VNTLPTTVKNDGALTRFASANDETIAGLDHTTTQSASLFPASGQPAEEARPSEYRSLDAARPLNPAKFPNPPRAPSKIPPTTIANVEHMMQEYRVKVRYDVIRKKLQVHLPDRPLTSDNADGTVLTEVISLAALNGMNLGQIPPMVEAVGDRHLYNPVAEWIHSKPWDSVDRLPDLYATLTERPDFPAALKHTVMHRWLLSAAAAALVPIGFRTRGVLTLQGPQGIGKTAWTKALVSDPDLARQVVKLDHHLDPSDKDSLISAIVHWIVEIGELDSSFKKDIAKLKGFLTSDQDKVRRPYARAASEYQRRTVFCATVNDDTFLVDPTGNTRWWTIPLVGINYTHNIDMQQVFAQLASEVAKGEQWWLTKDEEAWLEEHNKKHRAVNAVRERILDALDLSRVGEADLPAKTATQVLEFIGIKNPSNIQCKECGAVLREFLGEPTRSQGRDRWRVPFELSYVELHSNLFQRSTEG
jgi:putative DNA primase/helicase